MSDLTKLIDGIREVMKDHVWDPITIWDLCSQTDERIAEAIAMHRSIRRINTFLDELVHSDLSPKTATPGMTTEDWARVTR